QIETLHQQLEHNIPPIVFVATQDLSYWKEATGHAVVVAGLDEQSIYLHDPSFAEAPKNVPLPEFDLAWLGMDEFFALLQPK
ncbi:MAG: C39 family peptidase, partial [Anaerolineae bacterium]|nr:C39 family peptidase [Anaerolineae bacterium]